MDGQKSQLKLMRTNSSLLRSSPTFRSPAHGLPPAITEEGSSSPDPKEKDSGRLGSSLTAHHHRSGPVRLGPFLAAVFSTLTVSLFFLFFLHWRGDDTTSSENLLLALIFLAITMYFTSRNKRLIRNNLLAIKSLCGLNCFSFLRKSHQPVEWFIGDDVASSNQKPNNKSAPVTHTSSSNIGVIREGVEFYSNGDYYEGEFHKGKCNGSGVYSYFANGRYEGEWVDGKYDGFGIESWARGSRYRGQYRAGLRHGHGVYRFYTGDSYAGEWWNGQSHGLGVQTCGDGSCYVGQFKCGVKHGLGCYHFRNGDRYSGEYFGDKIHGFGIYHFANGHCYEGSWHEGQKQGTGMYTFRNGERRYGDWDSGNLKSHLPQLSESVVRAVQAARKTAENAIKLHRVDDQVSKAVMAANRAATAARVAAVKAVQNRMDGKFCELDV
ncbi:hypothetical protein SAY86_015153 [Trapa natans]|uniref:Uncharacterized protein n=1 Tax=Trapa natans TaxID=22666 RepID=A0AAN7QHJ4_TRANT|nr:hypothetical protein SAY86_015153 [Trapa natans]